MGSTLHLETEEGFESLEVTPLCGGLLEIEVADAAVTTAITLTAEQVAHLEAELYRWRIATTFEKKETDADGEPRPGAELEGGSPAPSGA